MKTPSSRILFVLATLACVGVFSQHAAAAPTAHFPDAHSLQPFPSAGGAHGNFSGNVNSRTGPAAQDFSRPSQPAAAPEAPLPAAEEKGNWDLEIGAALGIIALGSGFFLARKHKK